MEPLLFVLGILLAVVGVGLSIGLHEVGHLVPAKRFGVKVTQYMVGFGPTIWSRQHGETEYGIKAIPLGGYVRMLGMYPPPTGAPAGTAGRGTTGRFQLLAEEARAAAWEEVDPGDEPRLFYRLSAPRKAVIMLGGPLMNLLIAIGVFSVLLVGIGLPTPTTSVGQVFGCIPPAMQSQEAARAALADPSGTDELCPAGSTESPAAVVGLQAGDRITALDGQPVTEWDEVTEVTRSRPGQQVRFSVTGESGSRDLDVVLATVYRPQLDEDGTTTGEIVRTGYLGVSPDVQYVAQPWSAVPATMGDLTVRSGQALLTLPVRIAELAADMVRGDERDPESPVSVVGVGRLSGEVTAADEPIRSKIAILVSLLAGLNLFLFLFNLLPLLPLDGGHVAGAVWEGVRRRMAAIAGRPDPGPVDVAKMLPVAYAVGITLILLSSIVILADVVNPISIYG